MKRRMQLRCCSRVVHRERQTAVKRRFWLDSARLIACRCNVEEIGLLNTVVVRW